MIKQKFILQEVENFKKEWKFLQEERKLLTAREDLCFNRFLDRCKDIHELTFYERWNHVGSEEMYGESSACVRDDRLS